MNGRRSELAVAVVAGATAIALVYAMLVSERAAVTHALQLAAPDAVAPGADVPLRTFLLFGVSVGDAPTLTASEVTVELLEGDRVLASTTLAASPTSTAEGVLTAPDRAGDFVLHAVARLDGEIVATVARELSVAADAPPAAPLARLAPPLSQFALGPLVIEPSQLPPPAFDARVAGGVCVPDQPCQVLVDLGADGYDVRFEPGPAVTVTAGAEHEGRYARLTLQVTGPEGEGVLCALSNGTPVARRGLRLPVALATPTVALREPFVRDGRLAMELAPPPGRTTLIADLSRDDRFVRTLTLPGGALDEHGRRSVDLSFEGLPDGVYRVSVRADPFPTDHVIDRIVRLGPPAAPPFDADGPLAFAYHAAALEDEGLTLPTLVSGLEGDRARMESGQGLVRGFAIAAMLVAAVLIVLAVMRRGIASDAQAAKVLREAGATEDERAIRHQRLTLALTVLALAFALLAGTALVAARRLFG